MKKIVICGIQNQGIEIIEFLLTILFSSLLYELPRFISFFNYSTTCFSKFCSISEYLTPSALSIKSKERDLKVFHTFQLFNPYN
jgi:hypothetical protein